VAPGCHSPGSCFKQDGSSVEAMAEPGFNVLHSDVSESDGMPSEGSCSSSSGSSAAKSQRRAAGVSVVARVATTAVLGIVVVGILACVGVQTGIASRWTEWLGEAGSSVGLRRHKPEKAVLMNPCGDQMKQRAPERFLISFPTNYGTFAASCVRQRAPVWVDRVYNLAVNGYYDRNYFIRVVNKSNLKAVQFGTNGDPEVSNIYNWSSSTKKECAILEPQPPYMQRCMAGDPVSEHCPAGLGLSNIYGTLAMSTSYNMDITGYPTGVTWNATAELFINTGDNSRLDRDLFVPMCEINAAGMAVVLNFPSVGELVEVGGGGVNLGMLYQDGNSYIRANKSWDKMAQTRRVTVSEGALAL
jgi:cyclophilin family peptidyl-prolyl cis-trans isomerase